MKVTVAQAAEIYGVSRWTIHKWINKGLKHSFDKLCHRNQKVITLELVDIDDFLGGRDEVKNKLLPTLD